MNRKIVNFIIFSAIQFEKLRSKVGYHLLCALAIDSVFTFHTGFYLKICNFFGTEHKFSILCFTSA